MTGLSEIAFLFYRYPNQLMNSEWKKGIILDSNKSTIPDN